MIDDFTIAFEPITHWPDPETKNRRSPQFKAGYDATLRKLKAELRELDARGAVALQVVTRNGAVDLRRDGMLAARAQITHPGVRISFDSRHGPLTYSTDAFESIWAGSGPSWQANLRAIVLGLEALRAVDRYGISKSGQQYRGWQQIAARTGSSSGMSRDVALAVLREESGIDDPATVPLVDGYRLARKNAHPDVNKGDRTRWDALMAAAKTLGLEEG